MPLHYLTRSVSLLDRNLDPAGSVLAISSGLHFHWQCVFLPNGKASVVMITRSLSLQITGAAASPLRNLIVAAGFFMAATLDLFLNFYSAPMDRAQASTPEVFYLAPVILVFVYSYAAFRVARHRPGRGTIVVQYDPPGGITPAEARYLYTLSCDGRTYAACAVNLAARGLVAIEPASDGVYLSTAVGLREVREISEFKLPSDVPEEERVVFYELFHKRQIAVLKPPREQSLQQISSILQRRASSAYYDSRVDVLTIGLVIMSATAIWMAWAEGMLTRINGEIDLATAALLGGCLFSAGIASFFFWQQKRRAVLLAWRGIYRYRTLLYLLAPLFIMPGLFWLLMHRIAPAFANIIVFMLLLNTFAPPFLLGYTAEGSRVIRQLLGFRQFLETTEQDHLNRLGATVEDSKPNFSLIAYAMALDIRESWGDRLGVDAMTESAFHELMPDPVSIRENRW